MIGIVYYVDDPHQRVFRMVHLAPGDADSVFDDPCWVTEGIEPGRTAALVRIGDDDPRTVMTGTPWTPADEPLPLTDVV
jgi:hypothetical protein